MQFAGAVIQGAHPRVSSSANMLGVNMKSDGWPYRYEVTIQHIDGSRSAYTVLTWEGPKKAEQLALSRDAYISDLLIAEHGVEVSELGPAFRDESGLVALRGEIVDRREF